MIISHFALNFRENLGSKLFKMLIVLAIAFPNLLAHYCPGQQTRYNRYLNYASLTSKRAIDFSNLRIGLGPNFSLQRQVYFLFNQKFANDNDDVLIKYEAKIVTDKKTYYFPNDVGGRIRLKVVDVKSGLLVKNCVIYCEELNIRKNCVDGTAEIIIKPDRNRKYTLTFYAFKHGKQISDKTIITIVFTDIKLCFEVKRAVRKNEEYWVNYGDVVQVYIYPVLTATNETLYGVEVSFENKTLQLPTFIDITPSLGETEYLFKIINSPYNLAVNQVYKLRIVSTYILLEPDRLFYTFEELPVEARIRVLWAHNKKPVGGVLVECLETGEIKKSGKEGFVTFKLIDKRRKYSFTLAECFEKFICKCSPCKIDVVKNFIILDAQPILYVQPGNAAKLEINVTFDDGRPVNGATAYLAEKPDVKGLVRDGSAILKWCEEKPGVHEYTIMLKTIEKYVPCKILVVYTSFDFRIRDVVLSKNADRILVRSKILWIHNASPVVNAEVFSPELVKKVYSDENGNAVFEIRLDDVYKKDLSCLNLTICKELHGCVFCLKKHINIEFVPIKVEAYIYDNRAILLVEWLSDGRLILANGSQILLDSGRIEFYRRFKKKTLTGFTIKNAIYYSEEKICLLPPDQVNKPIIDDKLNLGVQLRTEFPPGSKAFVFVTVLSKAQLSTFLNTTVQLRARETAFIENIETLKPRGNQTLVFEVDKPLLGILNIEVKVENGNIVEEKSKKYLVIFAPLLPAILSPLIALAFKNRKVFGEKIDVESKIQAFRRVLKRLRQLLEHIREHISRKSEDLYV